MEALQRLHNRGSISTGYNIDNSLKLEADNTEYLEKTFSSDGNRKTYTTSMWIKRTEIGQASTLFGAQPTSGANNETTAQFGITVDDKFQCGFQTFYVVQTNRVLRDTSAWYHIVVRIDTTQSLVGDRLKIWINGEEETSFSTDNRTSIAQNQNTGINSTSPHRVGALIGNNWYFSGYMAEVHHVDGQALSPSDFAETDEDTGIWKPKAYTGSYGTNGFYLKFNNAGSLGTDSSGNSNNFTLNNITSADQATDTPTNNFVTWIGDGTPWNATAGDNSYTKDGATTVYHGATTGWSTIPTTQGVYGGKWYAELKWDSAKPNLFWGVLPVSRIGELPLNTYLGATDAHDGFGFYTDSTRVRYYEGTVVSPPQNLGLANGDIIQVAMDKDNGYVYFGINNTWTQDVNSVTGVPTSGSSGTGGWAMNYDDAYCFAASLYNPSASFPVNFGGYTAMTVSSSASDANGYGNFEYAPPSGYYALCSKNLAEFGG